MESSITNTINTITNVLLIISILFVFVQARRRHFILKLLIIVVVAVAVIKLPVYDGYSLNWLLSGIDGGLSINLLCILGLYVATRLFNLKCELVSIPFAMVIVIAGIILYLSTFGFISFDIYSLGYLPRFVLIPIGLVTICIFWGNNKFNGLILLLGLICFEFKVLHSNNLYDYLIDPVLWGICVVRILFGFQRDQLPPSELSGSLFLKL